MIHIYGRRSHFWSGNMRRLSSVKLTVLMDSHSSASWWYIYRVGSGAYNKPHFLRLARQGSYDLSFALLLGRVLLSSVWATRRWQ